MGAQENKQATQDAYAAFSKGDAEGAMSNIDDSIKWTVRGDNALSGTHEGKPLPPSSASRPARGIVASPAGYSEGDVEGERGGGAACLRDGERGSARL